MHTILIDGDNLAKRAIMASAKSDLQSGVWTGGIYNTLTMLRDLLAHPALSAGRIVAAWDDGVPAFRLKLVPEYRAERHKRPGTLTPEQKARAYGQLPLIREMFTTLGIINVRYPRMEGDDLLGELVRRFASGPDIPVVVSSDKDLLQLVSAGAWQLMLGGGELVNEANFMPHTGVTPDDYLLFKLLVGDTSDNIPGVDGVGEVRSAELVNGYRNAVGWNEDSVAEKLGLLVRWLEAQRDVRKLRKCEEAVIAQAAQLKRLIGAVDLSASFDRKYAGALTETLAESPVVSRTAFLKFAVRHHLGAVLGRPDHFLRPFATAEAMRNKYAKPTSPPRPTTLARRSTRVPGRPLARRRGSAGS